MPKLEYNFNDDQLNLILEDPNNPNELVESFDPFETSDYVRMSVFTRNGAFIDSYELDPNIDLFKDDSGNLFVKPNEVLEELQYGQGNYTIQLDFLRDYGSIEYYIDVPDIPGTDYSCIDVVSDVYSTWFCHNDIPPNVDIGTTVITCQVDSESESDISITIPIDENGYATEYAGMTSDEVCDSLDIADTVTPDIGYYANIFFVKEISPSRKEVRLFFRDENNNDLQIDPTEFKDILGDPIETADDLNPYLYDWVLGLPNAINIPIVNYAFDTRGETTTLILRLNTPLPGSIKELDSLRISKEVLTTQTQDIYFETARIRSMFTGTGLGSDHFGGLIELDTDTQSDLNPESYNDIITGSLLDRSSIENTISGSYKNLNIDYSQFSNHTFFGSAAQKLENFKSKVQDIEKYLFRISASFDVYGTSTNTLRKDNFKKIQTVINTFTPYERFLYFDNQSYSTGSAPGIGANLAKTFPINSGSSTTVSSNFDGFDTVYKITTNDIASNEDVEIFSGMYRAENPPFFNYSGSVYLSFILRADSAVTGSADQSVVGGFQWKNHNTRDPNNPVIPAQAFSSASIVASSSVKAGKANSHGITGSAYKRFVFAASQSYWRPTGSTAFPGVNGIASSVPINIFTSNPTDTTRFNILSSSLNIQSASYIDGTAHSITLNSEYQHFGTTITASGVPFSGSLLPSGELFKISWPDVSGVTAHFADIKVTLNNPKNVHPFGIVYSTGSNEWQDWYDGMHSSASSYDEANIHSLTNNLPRQVRTNVESSDLKKFTNMMGEQYDLIRNHVDNYDTFYSRKYKRVDSVPNNLLPVLADSLGWQVIQPFSSSLAEYFGSVTGDTNTNENVTYNTWRKVLNNLIYIYKSKGTIASVRALLNVYGYPPDVLAIQEFGGSTEEHNPTIITNDSATMLSGLSGQNKNVSFTKKQEKLYSYVFNDDNNHESRLLKFSWGANSATNPETIEFVMKPDISNNTQILLESTGSGAEKLWDLRLEKSGSVSRFGKLAFRLSQARTGSFGSITSSGSLVMSTSYLDFKTGGKLWNVMLQSMTSSITSSGIQTYRLFVGEQNEDRISQLEAVSMSVSGGLEAESAITGAYYANENWRGTGSLSDSTSENLILGGTFTGSIAEFRTWSEPLSASKFKQHILNKKSIVGNTITSSRHKVYYHYKLGENHVSGTGNPKIIDSNPKNVKDYSVNFNSNIFTGSSIWYDWTEIDTYKFTIRFGGSDQPNNNKVIINPTEPVIGNLNPEKSSIRTIYEDRGNTRVRSTSNKISITRSPQNVLNDFILDNIPDFNIGDYIGGPETAYSSSYVDLETLRKNLFDHFDVSVDINKWIRANAEAFKPSLITGLKAILPARSTTGNIGLQFEPNLLERNKIVHPRTAIQTGSAVGQLSANDITVSHSFDDTSYEAPKTGEYAVSSNIHTSSTYESPKSAEYLVSHNIHTSSTYEAPKSAEYSVSHNIHTSSTYEAPKEGTYSVSHNIQTSSVYKAPKEGTYLLSQNINTSSTYEATKLAQYLVSHNINTSSIYISTKNAEYSVYDNIDETAEYFVPKEGDNSYIASQSYASFINYSVKRSVHGGPEGVNDFDDGNTSRRGNIGGIWGTGSNDTHFVNYAYSASGNPDRDRFHNYDHWEIRDTFTLVGDVEGVSGSKHLTGSEYGWETKFDNEKNFMNREIRDKGKGYVYESLIVADGARPSQNNAWKGRTDGRPVGKTAYYITRSSTAGVNGDGDLWYPVNHWIHFVDDMRTNFNNGYKNGEKVTYDSSTNTFTYDSSHLKPFPHPKYEDLSTASFYSVTIGDHSDITARRGAPSLTKNVGGRVIRK